MSASAIPFLTDEEAERGSALSSWISQVREVSRLRARFGGRVAQACAVRTQSHHRVVSPPNLWLLQQARTPEPFRAG